MTDKLNVFDIHVHNFVHDTCEQETDKHCIIFLLLNNKFYQRPLTTLGWPACLECSRLWC
jgi:hypothetical protein